MGYVFDNVTGKIQAIFLQSVPVPPAGFTYTNDPIANEQIIDSYRDVITFLLKKKDALKISGPNTIPAGKVSQIAVQKIDGTTLANKTATGDNDPVRYILEDPVAFENKKDSALVAGADSIKIAAPAVPTSARFLVFSPELQLLDGKVIFS